MYIQNKKGRKVKVSTKASASLSVTSSPCDYQLGDTGPGGGTIVSIPGVGANTGNFYYELNHVISQSASINNTGSSPAHSTWTWHNGAGSGEFFNCNNSGSLGYFSPSCTPPNAGDPVEFGAWGKSLSTITDYKFGSGELNTIAILASGHNSTQFNTGFQNAFELCQDVNAMPPTQFVSWSYFNDWFVPSAGEIKETYDNGFGSLFFIPGYGDGFLPLTSTAHDSTNPAHSGMGSIHHEQYLNNPPFTLGTYPNDNGDPDNKRFITYKDSVGYTAQPRGGDFGVWLMRKFTCEPGACNNLGQIVMSQNIPGAELVYWANHNVLHPPGGTSSAGSTLNNMVLQPAPGTNAITAIGLTGQSGANISMFGNKLYTVADPQYENNGEDFIQEYYIDFISNTYVLNRNISMATLISAEPEFECRYTAGSHTMIDEFQMLVHSAGYPYDLYLLDLSPGNNNINIPVIWKRPNYLLSFDPNNPTQNNNDLGWGEPREIHYYKDTGQGDAVLISGMGIHNLGLGTGIAYVHPVHSVVEIAGGQVSEMLRSNPINPPTGVTSGAHDQCQGIYTTDQGGSYDETWMNTPGGLRQVTFCPLTIQDCIGHNTDPDHMHLPQYWGADSTCPGTKPDCGITVIDRPCDYQIGDIGPAGGVIVAVPYTGINNSPFYYEFGLEDIADQESDVNDFITVDSNINPTTILSGSLQPGCEWGSYKTLISLSIDQNNLGQYKSKLFGEGKYNTDVIEAVVPTPYPTTNHPVYNGNKVAADACLLHNGGGHQDWFLPSYDEFEYAIVASNVWTGVLGNNNLLAYFPNQKLYWTSTPQLKDANDPQMNAKAYAFFMQTQSSLIGYRTRALAVRPMRRFTCTNTPPGDWNFRDGYTSWSRFYMPPVFTPGLCGSGLSTAEEIVNDCIGFNGFTMSVARTDAMGNIHDLSTYDDANNPRGYTISVFTNEKVFLGTWHYQNCTAHVQSGCAQTGINTNCSVNILTQVRPDGNPIVLPAAIPATPDLPDMISLDFANVTHINGSHPVVRYGRNSCDDDAAVAALGIHLNQYVAEYRQGTYLGWTASHCFFKIQCATIENFGANAYADINGPNTDPQNIAVICTGRRWWNPILGVYVDPNSTLNNSGWTSGYPNTPLMIAGQIGTGIVSGGNFAGQKNCWQHNQVYGPGMGWNFNNAPYGLAWRANKTPNGNVNWPMHYMHEWFAVNPPSAATLAHGISWFPDMQTAIDNTTAHFPNGPCVTGLTAQPPVPVANPNVLQSKKINKKRGLGPCCDQKEIIEDVEEITPSDLPDDTKIGDGYEFDDSEEQHYG